MRRPAGGWRASALPWPPSPTPEHPTRSGRRAQTSAPLLDRSAEIALTHAPGRAPQDRRRKVLAHAPENTFELFGGTRFEDGGVDAVGLALGPAVGVVIQRQRLAGHVFRAIERVGVPVERFAGGRKDGQAVEHRQDLVATERGVLDRKST